MIIRSKRRKIESFSDLLDLAYEELDSSEYYNLVALEVLDWLEASCDPMWYLICSIRSLVEGKR